MRDIELTHAVPPIGTGYRAEWYIEVTVADGYNL